MPVLPEVHPVDVPLTDLSLAHFQAPGNFVGRRFAPAVPTGKQSDRYFIYTKADLLRSDAQKRAPNTESAGRTYRLSPNTFFCDVWAVHHDISEQVRANSDPVLDPEEDAVRVLTQDLMIREEQELATAVFSTGVWDTDSTGGGAGFTQWSDAASTPISDVFTGHRTINLNTGEKANKFLCGARTWYDGLANHPDLLDRIKYTQRGVVTEDLVAGLFQVDDFMVGYSVRNTAEEGLTASYAFNLDDDGLLAHVASNPAPRTPSAAYTFVWSGLTGAVQGIRTKRYDIPQQDAYPRVEMDYAFDIVVTGSDLGYFFSNAV